jgi:trigger factor
MKTTVTELPESRVRVEAEVPPEEVQRRIDAAARSLAKDLRMPGFRKGKVPAPVVIKRFGREAVVDEAVRGSIGQWYAKAIDEAGIAPVGDPKVDVGDLPAEGEALTFSIEIGVRPKAELGEYKGVEVGRRDPDVDEETIDREVEALRERGARWETLEGAAESGDSIVMDYKGSIDDVPFEGGEGRDQLIELGSGQLIPGFEDQLLGKSAGDDVKVEVTFPAEYQAENLAGKDAVFEVTVKEVKRKELPALDDDFAVDAAGFDSMEELRGDIRARLEELESRRIENDYREAVLDSAVRDATIEVPEALVEARARELLDRTLHQLAHQGISRDVYFRIAGKDEDELIEEAKPDADKALRRDAVLAAIVEAESIEATDEDVLEALEDSAQQGGQKPEKLMERLRKDGRLDELKDDLAQRKALDFLTDNAQAISVEDAEAQGKLSTPAPEQPEQAQTPGS